MKQQIIFPRCPIERRQPLLQTQHSSCGSSRRLAEVAGGTTAELAAVSCCFPGALVNFAVLAAYKVPAGLCRNAMRKKRRRQLLNKGLLGPGGGHHRGRVDGVEFTTGHPTLAAERFLTMEPDKDVKALEDEMWEKFYGTGFWRSPSQRFDRD